MAVHHFEPTHYYTQIGSHAPVLRIADGDTVEVFNARGRIELTARIAGTVSEGVVASRLSWNKLSRGRHNVNLLTSQRLTDFGGGPTFYSTLVEVRKIGIDSGAHRAPESENSI